MMHPRYTSKELARHATASDCWVAVHGKVLDVTHFIRKHPGGVSALTKAGRAGCDVTKHFDNVQHSATALGILDTLQIGILDEDGTDIESESESASLLESTPTTPINGNNSSTPTTEASTPNIQALDEVQYMREYSIRWHAARRKAILRDHPEVAALIGTNPWTCLIGALTVLVHCYTCILCQGYDWYWSIVLAYTIGALCKMYQFAVCHDVCHDTAGSWLKHSPLLKRIALQCFTLPAFGGATHSYYEIQHIGHHASLGSQALEEVAPNTRSTGSISAEQMNKSIFFPDGDGDLFAVGTLSLGSLLQRWNMHKDVEISIFDNEMGAKRDSTSTNGANYSKLFIANLPSYHRDYKLFKCVFVQFWHLLHHASITVFFLYGLAVIPPFCLIGFVWPDWCAVKVMGLIDHLIKIQSERKPSKEAMPASYIYAVDAARQASTSSDTAATGSGGNPTSAPKGAAKFLSPELRQLLVGHFVRISGSVGLHSWLWVLLVVYLLFGGWCTSTSTAGGCPFTLASVGKGFVYLYLSDLFLYGFAMHPYMGYFLGVHRSGGKGFESKRDAANVDMGDVLRAAGHPIDAARLCQPTMSTYSTPCALATMNLTYHVEHHDFPGVPWSRLPQISKLAPEYYNGLEQSPGLWYTVYQWIQHSEGWGYACQ